MSDPQRVPAIAFLQCPGGYRWSPDLKDQRADPTPCQKTIQPVPAPTCKAGERAFETARAIFEPGSPVTQWECRACPEGQYWAARLWESTREFTYRCELKTPFTEGTATPLDYVIRDVREASQHIGVQASAVALALVVFVLAKWWQMKDLSVVQILGVLGLAGAGTYFVSTAVRIPSIYTQEPWALSVGVMLLLAAFFVTRGWLSRR